MNYSKIRSNHDFVAGETRSGPRAHEICFLIIFAMIALAAVFFLAERRPVDRVRLLCAFDVSGSQTEARRKIGCRTANHVIEGVLPAGSTVTVWTFSKGADKIYEGRPTEARDLIPMEKAVIAAKSPGIGTSPVQVFQAMVQDSANGNCPIVCWMLWDGDDLSFERTNEAARRMAALPRLQCFWVAGVPNRPGLRKYVEKVLAPLGNRLIVSGEFDSTDAFERCSRMVREIAR
jgi:hypothetical protein